MKLLPLRMLEASAAIANALNAYQGGGNASSSSPSAGGVGNSSVADTGSTLSRSLVPTEKAGVQDWAFLVIIVLYFAVAGCVLVVFLIRLYLEGLRRRW